jgi:hypothetical protein
MNPRLYHAPAPDGWASWRYAQPLVPRLDEVLSTHRQEKPHHTRLTP